MSARTEWRQTAFYLLLSCAATFMNGPATANDTRHFEIAATDLASALRLYSVQSGRQILYPQELVSQLRSGSVQGNFSPEAALKILLYNTGLSADQTTSGIITLQREPEAAARSLSRKRHIENLAD